MNCGYTRQVYAIADDHIPALTFRLRDDSQAAVGRVLDPHDSETWKPMDLTHTTVRMYFRKFGAKEGEVLRTFAVLKHAPFTSGLCTVNWIPGSEMNIEPGLYEGEIETTHRVTGYKQSVWTRFRFVYRQDFDDALTAEPEGGDLV